MFDELDTLIQKINQIKGSNSLDKYIDFIQFPFYRNLELNTRINFDFPLTVFVGQNGSGKSSTLHALYGAPYGQTPYDFWFDTAVDPIKYYNDEKKRHSFFYSYQNENGEDLEVVKARIKREGNPNYWETSRPLQWAGMQEIPDDADRERNPPIRKNVVYLDFRSELSAFDKYFYFRTPDGLKAKNKQEYLRYKSRYLRNVFNEKRNVIQGPHSSDQNKPLEKLSDEELDIISFILGRNYQKGKFVEHKFFDDWGYSVKFNTELASYSEAFAGSGEVAIVRLVKQIHQADANSLILLDEPEVSLHPGAEHRLKLFLLNQIKEKKHQIILATHSSTLVEELPKEAIKVFYPNPNTGRFNVDENRTHQEAFYHIELPNPDRNEIIVEDILSKKILEAVLKSLGEDILSTIEVKFFPGGSSVIKTDFIKVYSQEPHSKRFIIFDGDEKEVDQHLDPTNLSDANKNTENLNELIFNQTGCEVNFNPNSGNNGAEEDGEIDLMIQYLNYYKKYVYYLPGEQPEEIIWNQEYADSILGTREDKEEVLDEIQNAETFKEKLYYLKNALFDKEEKIDNLYSMFIKHWIDQPDDNYQKIVDLLNNIRQN